MKTIHQLKRVFNNTLIVFISCSLIGFLLYSYAVKSLTKTIENSLIELAKQGSIIIQQDIRNHLDLLEKIGKADLIKNDSNSIKEKLEFLNSLLESTGFLRISIADMEGNAYTTDGSKINIADRQYFQEAVLGNPTVSDPLISRVDGRYVVAFAVPIYQQKKITGVLYATYDVAELSRMTDDIKFGNDGSSFVLNQNGDTIAHQNRELVYKRDNDFENIKVDRTLKRLVALEELMVRGETGAGGYSYHGMEKYMGYAPIQGTHWSIAVTAPKKQLFTNINQMLFFVISSIFIIILIIASMNLYTRYLKRKLQKEQMTSSSAIEAANILVIKFTSHGEIVDFNHYAEIKTGFSREEIVGKKNIYSLIAHSDKGIMHKFMDYYKKGVPLKNFEFGLFTKADNMLHVVWNISTMEELKKKRNAIEIMGIDITARVLAEKEYQLSLHNLAYYDALTKLPNRLSLNEQLPPLLMNNPCKKCAVFFVDSDNFKWINDTLGHTMGDQFLIKISERLTSLLEENCKVYRIGGDEFVIFINEFDQINEVERLAQKILDGFRAPFEIDSSVMHTSVSIGIAVYPDHGASLEEILKNADIAMYKAKEEGKNRYLFHSKSMNDAVVERMTIEKHLCKALDNDEFSLYYQPQINLKTGKIAGFEALLRWNNPTLGAVSPLQFIKIAEDNRFIIPLGEWVLWNACFFIKELQMQGYEDFTVAVNISILQLIQKDFADIIIQILHEMDITPACLELEITESILMESFETIIGNLEVLRNIGVNIALDDFGKGYSSLSYLKQLPITTLKIDKSFIDSISSENDNKNLVEAIIPIGHKMEMKVVAEGVETKKQLDYLRMCNCDKIQGYIFSKPLAKDKVTPFLQKFKI